MLQQDILAGLSYIEYQGIQMISDSEQKPHCSSADADDFILGRLSKFLSGVMKYVGSQYI